MLRRPKQAEGNITCGDRGAGAMMSDLKLFLVFTRQKACLQREKIKQSGLSARGSPFFALAPGTIYCRCLIPPEALDQ